MILFYINYNGKITVKKISKPQKSGGFVELLCPHTLCVCDYQMKILLSHSDIYVNTMYLEMIRIIMYNKLIL